MSKPVNLKPGSFYHIFNRGTNRENLFKEPRNCEYFLRLYDRHMQGILELYSYCLLGNHFHMLVRVSNGVTSRRASQSLGNWFNAYAKSINKGYSRTGSLFEHPYHRVEIESPAYLLQLVIYIHRNPQHHGLTKDFRRWPTSSYGSIVDKATSRVLSQPVINWFGTVKRLVSAHADARANDDFVNRHASEFDL